MPGFGAPGTCSCRWSLYRLYLGDLACSGASLLPSFVLFREVSDQGAMYKHLGDGGHVFRNLRDAEALLPQLDELVAVVL
jgi:hypothetical protein